MKSFIGRYKKMIIVLLLVLFYVCGTLHVVSVTSLYEPMGDDKANLLIYKLVQEKGLDLWMKDFFSTLQRICTLKGRYFPVPTAPLFLLKLISESIFRYRLYIAIVTFVDIILVVFLLYRLNIKSWVYTAVLGPIMLNLFGYNDGNALYSYIAAVQSVFMMMLFALHFELSWIRTKKACFFVLTFLSTIMGCFQYEIGYLVIFPAMVIAWIGLVESMPTGVINKLVVYLRNICSTLIPIVCAFIIYMISNYNAMGVVATDTTINLSWSRVLLATIMELAAGLPIRTALNTYGLLTRNEIILQDVLYPGVTALLFLVLFVVVKNERIELRSYFRGVLFALSIILPTAVLISLTIRFQPDMSAWVSWQSGWIVSIICTFGYMILAGYIVYGIRQTIDSAYKNHRILGNIVKIASGLIITVLIFLCAVYGHATARINGNNRAYMYSFIGESLTNGLLSDAKENSVVVSNYNVWGGYDGAESAFLQAYTGKEYDAYFVDSYWEHGADKGTREIFIFNVIYGAKDKTDKMNKTAQMAIASRAKDEELLLSDSVKLYIDLSSFEDLEYIKYEVLDGDEIIEKRIDNSELNHLSSGKDKFFYEIRDENILIQDISISE